MANLLFSQFSNGKKVDLSKNTLQIDTVSVSDVTLSGEQQDILITRVDHA